MTLLQEPGAGTRLVKYAGDMLEIRLGGISSETARAFVRTDFGSMDARRRAVVAKTEGGRCSASGDWHDVEMMRQGDCAFARFPLADVGVFEFKAYAVMPDGRREWVDGANLRVKVEPALTVADNAIYNAFIRQFGPNMAGGGRDSDVLSAERFLNEKGYTVLPPSGTFASFRERLGFISETLGFRIVMFLPVHPVPSSYARMGRFGSAFAPLDFYTVDASMAVFDRFETPLGQFGNVIDDIHSRHGLVFMDLPLDHTGWASSLQMLHPELFKRNDDGSFQNPGAWGVSWDDLCKLDFSDKRLWREMADVLLHWCRMGADGFRCDAGYMIPEEAWEYMTAKTRLQYPDTVFLLEGLGGSVDVTRSLLESGCMNWAYSESFQQFGYQAENEYLRKTLDSFAHSGLLVNFAETHDNSRLAAVSSAWAVQRTAGAAMLAPAGAFGIANGVEWLAKEKIDVHDDSSLNWGAQENIVALVSSINRLLAKHPCFSGHSELFFIESLHGEALALIRKCGGLSVLVLVNPNGFNEIEVSWGRGEFDCGDSPCDLLTRHAVSVPCSDGCCHLTLPPGMVLCLSKEPFETDGIVGVPAVRQQELRRSAMRLMCAIGCSNLLGEKELENMAEFLGRNVRDFMAELVAMSGRRLFTEWHVGRDARRIVMLPQGGILLLCCDSHFNAELRRNGATLEKQNSIADDCGFHYLFLTSSSRLLASDGSELEIIVKEFKGNGAERHCGRVTLLSADEQHLVHTRLAMNDITNCECGICVNSISTMTMARAAWGSVQSKYDALLAANCAVSYPADRMAALLRIRAWLRFRDFSTELSIACQRCFESSYDNSLAWEFEVPCGLGLRALLRVTWQLDSSTNSGRMFFEFDDCGALARDFYGDSVTLVVRPDVDFRSVHGVTKAYMVEKQWNEAINAFYGGFDFMAADAACVHVGMSGGRFHKETEWHYSVPLPVEQERGLEGCMDFFSPGYFEFSFSGKGTAVMEAAVGDAMPSEHGMRPAGYGPYCLEESLRSGMERFLVRRDGHKTVIAGYPWFLDWGRDTLICLRGYIKAGMLDTALDIFRLFAQFEHNGTLPNMIRGTDTSDRDTSDAPLWLYVVVGDYIEATGNSLVLSQDCGGRTLAAILEELALSLWNGAENGVRADKESGLIYSPPHFTWMDTNYPAGTPREGYPVEIQALWIYATGLLARHSGNAFWRDVSENAKKGLVRLFGRKDGKGLSDCLHCNGFKPAEMAEADDACRPNQLLAITLGAIDDTRLADAVLEACAALLTPAGIRSLDDASVNYPLPINDNGTALNDPLNPYWGRYSGFEDTSRKPAYHNGTSWGWQMPLWCEADYMLHGERSRAVDLALMSSAVGVMEHGCIGYIPEIYDGDAPHAQKGCSAQAWSMTEFYRVLRILKG